MSGDEVQLGFRVTGRVQGVFFRVWTRKTALELGLRGTVRNRRDGSVEAHVVGPIQAVEAFRALLWKGSEASDVWGVEEVASPEPWAGDSFQVLPTA